MDDIRAKAIEAATETIWPGLDRRGEEWELMHAHMSVAIAAYEAALCHPPKTAS
ncbi:MAG: hypothetical protein ACR2QF_01310 [Geminicoccaceae bacterium]